MRPTSSFSEFGTFNATRDQIRLFGDPQDNNQETPTLRIKVAVTAEEKQKTVVREQSHDVVCDFVDGFALGDALGVGLRAIDGWWEVDGIEPPKEFPSVGKPSPGLCQKMLISIAVSEYLSECPQQASYCSFPDPDRPNIDQADWKI